MRTMVALHQHLCATNCAPAKPHVQTLRRGGIPVCWPQFNDLGPVQAHGFARNSVFSVVALKGSSVIMELLPDAANWSDEARAAFPIDFVLRCTVAVSDDHGGSLTQVVCAPGCAWLRLVSDTCAAYQCGAFT